MKVLAISLCIISIVTICISYILIRKCKIFINRFNNNKDKLYYEVLNTWLENRNNNKYIYNHLIKKNINNIAIYGAGELGKRLYEEIKGSDLNILFFIDSNLNIEDEFKDTKVLRPEEIKNHKIEYIIVTPIHVYESIKDDLKNINNNAVTISLKDLIFDIYFE